MKILLGLFAALIVLVPQVFAEDYLEAFTDKSTYYSGDTITVFGETPHPQEFIKIYINTPGISLPELYHTKSFFTDNNGAYTATFNIINYTSDVQYRVAVSTDYLTEYKYVDYYVNKTYSISFESEKEIYYKDEILHVHGEIYGFTNPENELVEIDYFMEDGTQFQFTSSFSVGVDATFGEHGDYHPGLTGYDGYITAVAKILDTNYEQSTTFYYTNEIDMREESLYFMIQDLETQYFDLLTSYTQMEGQIQTLQEDEEIPSQCETIHHYDTHMDGSEGNDTLTGNNGQTNIIFGFGGDDVINGANKDDCLVGGHGDDILYGGNGDDIIDGGEGLADYIDGGDGYDICMNAATYVNCEES